MSKYFETPFANSGDKTPIPDPVQIDGSVSYESGFTPDYQADQETDPNAKDVDRAQENQFKHDVTEVLKETQEQGLLPYRNDVNYPVNAKASAANGFGYKASIINGPASSVVLPVGDTSGTWKPVKPVPTDLSGGSRASVGTIVRGDNSGGSITILLQVDGLEDGDEILFDPDTPELYAVNSVTFDADTNTVGPTYQTIEVTTDNLLGGFKWDASNGYWIGIKRAATGTEF